MYEFVLSLTSVFFSLTSFAYVKKKKRWKKEEELMSSTSNVYMNWLKLNMKI